MGFFDRIRGKQSKTESLKNDPHTSETVNQNLEEGHGYKKLFLYDLRLGTTLQKMGVDNIDLEELLAKENIEEKTGDNTPQCARCKQKDLTIVFEINKDVITVKIDKSSNGREGKRATLTFDKKTHLETKRVIQDYIWEDNRAQPINMISIERNPRRIEQVEYSHLVKRTWQDIKDIKDSIDSVYRQIPGGSKIVGTPEEIDEFEFAHVPDSRYYPSYLDNTVLMKQIDLSNVSGDISSLESLHGLDDSEISRLAGLRDSNAEEKCSRISSKIFDSFRMSEYLKNILYPAPGCENRFDDNDVVAEYRNTIKRNFEKDREKFDKQNQSTDLYDVNGKKITIYAKDGTPITKSYIAQLIELKQKYDKCYEEQVGKYNGLLPYSGDEYEFD